MYKVSKICYLILPVFFHSYCQSLIFWKEYWALGCVSIRIWHFLTFPKILSLKSFGNSWGNSCTKFVIILDIKYRFDCGYSDLCWIIKGAKYYDRDCSIKKNYFERRNEHWAIILRRFEIFLIFPNFLRSWVSTRLAICMYVTV